MSIKQETIDSLRRYADEKTPTGGFLRAVLENNLMESFGRSDTGNRESMFEICEYIYNEMQLACHGSPEKVKKWLEVDE